MLCVIYKSPKKAQTYLFIKQRDKFEDVPEALMAMFGIPTLVTIINLDNKDKLALADINKVRENLNNQGFYLQLPPPQEDLLKEHKEQMKLKSQQV
ncbi:YcgL domain-containing protein [Thalassotalea sp. SU-HH00458]|uniref:YcgL domain-containing protein n=1 Tax=Thalassotalea sp. SU-HH00458 TaxID=3127657 RepID=UPI0031090B6D